MQIRFPSPDSRSAFVAILKSRDPYLYGHVRLLYAQPHVAIVSGIDGHGTVRLRSFLASFGGGAQLFDDVQFETFA